tara:strand:- start:220 stop:1734 length:1515 start_codon:yes stop_codon:yes gene_type:complete
MIILKKIFVFLTILVFSSSFIYGAGHIKYGGTLRIAMSGDIDTFDPHVTPLTKASLVNQLIFNRLVQYDVDLNVIPELAEWDQVNALEWIFKLKRGVRFHNGRGMTADDVKYSLERGKKEDILVSKFVKNLKSIDVINNYTLKITLNEQRGYWLKDLTNIPIIPKESVSTLKSKPIGTGAFKFVEWAPNDKIVLKKNADYWDKGKPYLDNIIIRVIPDMQARLANLESGDIDVIRSVNTIDALRYISSEDVKVLQAKDTTYTEFFHMMGANNLDIWGNKRVRQALAHCLDKDTIQNTVFFRQGKQVWSSVPPNSFAYVKQTGYKYDPEITKKILKEENVNNLEFTVDILTGRPEAEQLVTIWQAGCAKADVKINIRVSETSLWLDRYLKQNYDVIWNTMGQPGDPNNFYNIIVGRLARGKFCGPSGKENCYSNSEYADLLAKSNKELNRNNQLKYLKRIQEIIVEDLPVIMVQTKPLISLSRNNVNNWKISASARMWARDVWLD